MTAEMSESAILMADRNRRLQELVAELLKKNEGLRQQLAAAQEIARAAAGVGRAAN